MRSWLKIGCLAVVAGGLFMSMPVGTYALSVVERGEVPFDEALSDQEENAYAPVSAVALARISPPGDAQFGDSASWVQGLYYYSIVKLGFADIPFNYIVTWRGDVYEGKGGGMDVVPIVDFGDGDDLGTVALVAYFDNNQEITNTGEDAVHALVSDILSQNSLSRSDVVAVDAFLSPASEDIALSSLILRRTSNLEWRDFVSGIQESAVIVPSAESGEVKGTVESVEYVESVVAGQNFVVTAKIQNEGDSPWYPEGDGKIFLATSDPRNKESRFFVTDKWASFTRVVTAAEDWILPGTAGTFEFEMQTPLVSGEYTETFELLLLPDWWIPGTKFEVPFTVSEGDFKLVEILETETGYLNVRECPSQGCAEVGKVTPGETLIWEEVQNGWYYIQLDGGTKGWVYGKYVKEI